MQFMKKHVGLTNCKLLFLILLFFLNLCVLNYRFNLIVKCDLLLLGMNQPVRTHACVLLAYFLTIIIAFYATACL
jgi:hypothetical protein